MTTVKRPTRMLQNCLRIVFWGTLAAVTVATHVPRIDPSLLEFLEGPVEADKSAHFIAYGLLGLLGALAFRPPPGGSSLAGLPSRMGRLFAALAAWAVVDEATQPLVGRIADPLDWLCDAIGLAIGIAAGAAAIVFARRRLSARTDDPAN